MSMSEPEFSVHLELALSPLEGRAPTWRDFEVELAGGIKDFEKVAREQFATYLANLAEEEA